MLSNQLDEHLFLGTVKTFFWQRWLSPSRKTGPDSNRKKEEGENGRKGGKAENGSGREM